MEENFFADTLANLEEKRLKRTLRVVGGAQGPHIIIEGREYINLCSNNYLGLADDPRLRQAAVRSVSESGVGSGASRLVCGTMQAHAALEEKLAALKGTERCIVFSTGYMANVGIISSVCGRGDMIISDKLNHASIVDGILLSGAQFRRYRHIDMESLEEALVKSAGARKRLIVTDSVFSMDGDTAPLEHIVTLARRYNALIMVDEAHAFGVFGDNGTGLVEQYGLEKEIDIQMGTLSKAAGSFGAYCCGSNELIEFLINTARSFIYTTALPPVAADAARAAIGIIESEPHRRQALWEHTYYMLSELKRLGFNTLASQSPIIPVVVGDAERALTFSQQLFERGIFVQAIRPPTVPENTARLRVTVMATHTADDLSRALEAFKEIGRAACLI